MTQQQDFIIDHVGAETWSQVVEQFFGKTLEQIKIELAGMFPSENNEKLANMIHKEMNR